MTFLTLDRDKRPSITDHLTSALLAHVVVYF